MSNQAKQRFIGLKVDEISVVDAPAIEVEFLVTKRLEEATMPTAENPVNETTGSEETPSVETVPVEAASTNDEQAVSKTLEHVASVVENIAKMAGVNVAPAAEEPAAEPAAEPTEEPTEKAKNPRSIFMSQLKSAGVKGDALTKAMGEYDKAMMPPKTEKTAKSVDGAPAEEQPATEQNVADANTALVALEQAIQKAKTFTPARLATLKEMSTTLQKLLGEIEQVPTTSSPKTKVPTSPSFGQSEVMTLTKSIGDLTEAVQKSVNGQDQLAQRVEAIEKARTPSQALPPEETETTQTVKKGFWAGVL